MAARGLSNQLDLGTHARHLVVRWSPCALGTRTRTLCSSFNIVDNLSRGEMHTSSVMDGVASEAAF